MSTSTNAILAYGYDLGGDEGEWKIRETGEYGGPNLDWYNPETDEDFVEAAERRLLAEIAGFTETDWRADGYFDREREAEARVGVELETYCHGDYPMYLLAAHVITVRRGDVENIDPVALSRQPVELDWDAKLQSAITALGITPVQDQPRWLLCSYWC